VGPRHLIEAFGTVGILAIVFAESSLVFFLPGDSLLFTAGLLASQGKLNLAVILVGTFLAAVAGNHVGYAVGARAGVALFKPGSRLFKEEYVERARQYFERYGPKTIVLARFVPAVRTFAPILAGVGTMRYRTFAVYNLVGALLWAIGVTLLGWGLGESVPDVDKYLLPVIAVIVVLSVVPIALELRGNRRRVRGTSDRPGRPR
jgi:membrane-associated protein